MKEMFRLRALSHPTLPLILSGIAVASVLAALAPASASAHADPKTEGAALFGSTGCAHCHGDAGQGTPKGPGLVGNRKHLTAEQMRKQIKDGGQSMPPFGEVLDDAQVEKLIALLRAKRWPLIPTPPVSAPPPDSATPETTSPR